MGSSWKELFSGAAGVSNGKKSTGNFGLNSNPASNTGYDPNKSALARDQSHFNTGIKRMDTKKNNLAESKLGNKIENKKESSGAEKGALQYDKSIRTRKFVEQTIKEMDKTGAFDKFIVKGAQTKKNKIGLVLNMASKIEGKKVDINSFIHRDKAIKFGKGLLSGKESFGNKRSCYSGLQARKAIGGVIGKETGSNPINKWANRK
jgi:hypothetical protein